jgi:hypothetical protein
MYIIFHLYVVKDFEVLKILDQFWKVLWIFKALQLHIFLSKIFLIQLMGLYFLNFFPINFVLLYESLQIWFLLKQ